MRLSNLVLSALFLLGSCTNAQLYSSENEEEPSNEQPQAQSSAPAQATPQDLAPVYGTPYDRLADNVRIKQADAFGITYEYKDVRIDESAYLAAYYCHEQGEKRAYLYDSQLYKNYARRATFHCVELQN